MCETSSSAGHYEVMVTCSMCGTTTDELPMTWSSEVRDGRTTYLCEACTRQHLRSIEGRLDQGWW